MAEKPKVEMVDEPQSASPLQSVSRFSGLFSHLLTTLYPVV